MGNSIIDQMLEALEIPDTSYQLAEVRYKDLGEWINRKDSSCVLFKPSIRPQGSFRLGTVIRPINNQDEYDLDMTCVFEKGVLKSTHTQEQIKNLLGNEIEAYRKSKGIESEKEEKHRCWTLSYKDHIKFHLDVVPCIPEETLKIQDISSNIIKYGESHDFADSLAITSVAITDNRHPNYKYLSDDWYISNPEGYARWFEFRMRMGEKEFMEKVAGIEELPVYRLKKPLQKCVQILKRHRNVMFAHNDELKPASIIITTLAARAYSGETNIEDAIYNILPKMKIMVNRSTPRIPNPVDPREDFADKWSSVKGQALKLEQNFFNWLDQAMADFDVIRKSQDIQFIEEQASRKYSISLDRNRIGETLQIKGPTIRIQPKHHDIESSPKPWQQY